jgi:glycosyltransferase involved in cell wall biosynthesis
MVNHMPVQLSLVLCTHRRFQLLGLALESLCKQSAGKEAFEVIVVDNDLTPNPEVKQLVEQASDKIQVAYVFDPVLGLSQARNSGGKASQSPYIGYLDDDARADENYVQTALEIIRNRKPDYFGGPYYPYYLDGKPAWFLDRYESGITAEETRMLKAGEFLNGTNMIYRRELLDRLGWFDTGFGMTGRKIGYGEETALQMKAWEQAPAPMVFYSTDLFVYHLAAPVKLKLGDRFKRRYNTGRSQAYLWITEDQKKKAQQRAPFILGKTLVYFFVKGLPGLMLRDKKKYPSWQNYAYEVLANYAAGVGQEWTYIKNLITK